MIPTTPSPPRLDPTISSRAGAALCHAFPRACSQAALVPCLHHGWRGAGVSESGLFLREGWSMHRRTERGLLGVVGTFPAPLFSSHSERVRPVSGSP